MATNITPSSLTTSLADSLWAFIMLTITVLTSTKINLVFAGLFTFRYTRLIINMIAYYGIYKPTPIPANPTLYPRDCTVIIPTVDPENAGFQECIRTVLENKPGAILIVTVGKDKLKLIKRVVKPLQDSWPATTISVTASDIANKRLQVCHAIPQVKTALTVLVDDHVYWPSTIFLPTICAPFENPNVGGLGTNKVVRRSGSGYSLSSIFNFWGCVYLERHNFELTATNAIDGSVFVLSGRTSAHRTVILQDKDFLAGFSNEMFFFGKYGPIAADDDNFITRWEVKKGWDIKFQNCPDATIETDLGEPHKFLSQCMRWVRTTWRSNSCSLFTDRTVWRRQPWGVYAIYISSFFNFALFYDSALIYTLTKTTFGQTQHAMYYMAAWIFASKMVKLIPHMRRNPVDIVLIPAYLAFAYFHSFMKFWALLTFWDIQWSGRNLAAVNAEAQKDDSDDSDDSSDDDDDDDDDAPNMRNWDLHNDGYAVCVGPSRRVSATPFSPSSVASSIGSASYGISKWSQWEKASMHSNSVLRSRWPSTSLPAVSKHHEDSASKSAPNGPSLEDWLQRDVRPSVANSTRSTSSGSNSRKFPARPRSDYEPDESPSPVPMFPSGTPPGSIETPANPFVAVEVSDSDSNSRSRYSSFSSRTHSTSPPAGPTRFLSEDLPSSSSGSSYLSSGRSPHSSWTSYLSSFRPDPRPPSPPRPASYWTDLPATGVETPLPKPFTYSTSASSNSSSSSPRPFSDDDSAPLIPTDDTTPTDIRPAFGFTSPPRPQPAAPTSAPPPTHHQRQRRRDDSPSSPPHPAPVTRPTTMTTKRTRGADCGRQHEEGHRISGAGVCGLHGYIGDVGLAYYDGGKKRRRRM